MKLISPLAVPEFSVTLPVIALVTLLRVTEALAKPRVSAIKFAATSLPAVWEIPPSAAKKPIEPVPALTSALRTNPPPAVFDPARMLPPFDVRAPLMFTLPAKF